MQVSSIKLSLIDCDQTVQAKTDLDDTQNNALSSFIERIKEELVTGETATLEIEGHEKSPVRFEITQAV